MANKQDWLHDLLRDWAVWHLGGLSESEIQHAWPDSDTLWRACMSPIRMPPGSRPPGGAMPPRRDIDALIRAMNILTADSHCGFAIGIVRAFYLRGPQAAAEAGDIAVSSVWKHKQTGEAALRGFMSA